MAIKSADQITIIDVTDAYSVLLSSEAYTFAGNANGAASGLTCSTEVYAFQGSNRCMSVTVDKAKIVCPAGISASVEGSGTQLVKITFTTTAIITDSGEATIPVQVDDISMTKKFSFAVAKSGQNGKDGTSVTIKSQSVTYQVGSSGTTPPAGSWATELPNDATGKYLWTKTVVTYSDDTSTEAYSVSYNGTNGNDGTSVTVSNTSVTYQTSTSGTTTPTGTWSTEVPNVPNGQFLWTRTIVNYSDGKATTSYSVSYKGTNGTDGADAITVTITSSNGTVFKNSSGSTILTAHVFKGAAEQTVAPDGTVTGLGTIKWYKGTSKTVVHTGDTYEINASDVNNSEVFTCQLE